MLWNPNRKKLFAICVMILMVQTSCFAGATNYDKKQDKKITQNKDDIKTNKNNIKTNKNNIKTNKSNIGSNADAIDVNADGVSSNKSAVAGNTGAINSLNNRVNELEETQEIVSGQIRIHDSQKWEVTLFADYSLNRNTVDRTGVQIKYKFGKSYEEKKIEQIERRLEELED